IDISGIVDDQLVEGNETVVVTLSTTNNANAAIAASPNDNATVTIQDNDTATVTLSGSTTAAEGGATGSLTATLTLNTSGTGAPSLATDITGITLVGQPDYSSDTKSFSSGAVSGNTVTLTVTATDDQLVEGPESFLASLVDTTSNASVTETDRKSVVRERVDTATVAVSGSTKAAEGGATGSLTATLTLNTSGTGAPSLATNITGITLVGQADYRSDSK